MANTKNPQHFYDGIKLVPEATPTLTDEGTLKFDSDSDKLKVRGSAATGTVVEEAKAATLTNKTIVAADNTITTAASGNLAATTLNGALSELQTDIDTRALDSALTSHMSDTSTHGVGEVVGTTESQTLTNKTLTSPAITTPTGIVKGDVGLGNVDNTSDATKNAAAVTLTNKTITAPIISTISNTGTLTLPTSTDTLVGKATTDVLTNKTLSGNIATNLVSGAATVTLPTTTGTLATLANAETLSNKTFSDSPILAEIATPSTPASGYGKIYFKSDGFLYQLNDDGTETKVGAGSGGINYISANPDFESGTTGWATYADAAGASPVNGTAGSPTLTLTRTTSTPLRGTGSGLITKDANNRQGEGASYDFTISDADKFKVLSITFDYEIASGTYADSDLTVWIYDVTNTTLIQPAGSSLANATVESKHQATFQTTSSTSYRLIIHCSSTSASAYTVKIDNVQVGPNPVLYGAPISDWKSFTPTGTWSTNTTYTGLRRRIGDMEEFDIKVATAGAPTSATLSINLPVTIDTTKLTSIQANAGQIPGGIGNACDLGVATYPVQVNYTSTTAVTIAYINGDGTSAFSAAVTQAAPFTFGNTDFVHVHFSVPVVGYGSTVQMSSDTDTRVVAAQYKFTSAQTVSDTAVGNFSTKVFDTHNAVTTGAGGPGTSAWRFTAPVPGIYEVSLYMISASALANSVTLYKNSVSGERFFSGTGANLSGTASILVSLVAGDYIQVARDTGTYSVDWGIVNIKRLSGPSAIAATESINARYKTNASQSIVNNTLTIIDFEDRDFDSHGSVTIGAAWIFTAPSAGKYCVNVAAILNTGGGWAAAEPVEFNIYKNGSLYSAIVNYSQAAHTTYMQQNFSDLVSLVAGDYIDVRITQISGGTIAIQASENYTHIAIHRIGN